MGLGKMAACFVSAVVALYRFTGEDTAPHDRPVSKDSDVWSVDMRCNTTACLPGAIMVR